MKNYPKYQQVRDYSAFQDLFTKAMEGLAKQGWKRSFQRKGCAFRGDEPGMMCFVGQLIPDAEYLPKLEDLVLTDLVPVVPSLSAAFTRSGDNFMEFLLRGMTTHDSHGSPSTMQEDFQYMAATSNLKFPSHLE